MEDELWDAVYSKIPNIETVATKNNYASGDRKITKEIRELYLQFHLENETQSNELYTKMVLIQRQHFCKALNTLKIKEFKDWIFELENRLRNNDETPAVQEHLGKYRSLMPSLALIFHLLDVAGW